MTPQERAVHDAYPQLSNQMIEALGFLFQLPLEDMRTVATRIALTGIGSGMSHGMQVNPNAARAQQELIGKIIDFRGEVNRIAATAAPSPAQDLIQVATQ